MKLIFNYILTKFSHMFQYTLTSKLDISIQETILDQIATCTSQNVQQSQKGTLNILFVDELRIQNLNKNYRNKDAPTDVLSFHYFEDFSDLNQTDIAWEIVICENIMRNNAQEYKVPVLEEFYKIIIHATLHILGYDHENDKDHAEMKKLEEAIYAKVFEESAL